MFGTLAAGRISVTAVQALSLIILARWLSPEGFGEFSATFALQSTIMTIAALGMPRYVLREYAAGQLASVSRAFRMNAVVTCVAIVVCVVPALIWSDGPYNLILLILMGVALGVEKNSELRLSLFIADNRVARAGSGLFIRAVVNVLFLVGFGAIVDPLAAFVGARLFAAIVSALVYVWRSPDLGKEQVPTNNVIREMWGIGGTSAIGSLYGADSALMAWAAGSNAAGYFAAATKLVYPFGIFATPMAAVLMPAGVSMNRQQLGHAVRRMALAFGLLYIPSGLVAFIGHPLYSLVYGESYLDGVGVFLILALSIPTTVMNPLFETILQARRDDRFVFVVSTVCAVSGRIFLVVGGLLGGVAVATAAIVLTSTIQGWLLCWRSFVVVRRV